MPTPKKVKPAIPKSSAGAKRVNWSVKFVKFAVVMVKYVLIVISGQLGIPVPADHVIF